MIKKAVGIFLLALTVAGAPAFADHHGAAVGEWDMTLDFQGQEVPGTMTIEMDGDSLKGTWTGQGNTSELTKLKYAEDGTLTFNRSVEFGGQTYELTFTGKIEGDTVTGEFDTPMGPLDAEGSREGESKAPEDGGEGDEGGSSEGAAGGGVDALVGTWDTTTESQLGTLEAEMIFDVKITGVYKSEDAEYELRDIQVDGNDVTFNATAVIDGSELPLTFEGTMDNGKLTGEFITDMGNGQVTATKAGGGGGGADKAAIRSIVEDVMAALEKQDIDGMVANYAEDFTSDQGGGVAEMREFLQGAKENNFLEDLVITLDGMEIEVDGNKAIAEPIELEGNFGFLTLSYELEKRDGEWVITYQSQY